MHIQHVIENFGYRPSEAKVYLAALSLGESHISDIAAKVKLPRSSVRMAVDKLHRDGLINFYTRRRYKYWVAEKPERLLARLHEREEEVKAVLPRLEELSRNANGKPGVKVFEGAEEIKLVYEDIIETKQHIRGILPWDDWVHLVGTDFVEDFIERRVRHFLRFRLLVPKTEMTKALHAKDSKELRQTRFVPEYLPIKSAVFLYGTKTVFVSLNRKLPTAVLIDDSDIRDTVSIFFEEIWENRRREFSLL